MSARHVAILTPTAGQVEAGYVQSLAGLLLNPPQDVKLSYLSSSSSSISGNRHSLVRHALRTDCTHVLFIDSDMMVMTGALHQLLRHDRDIVGCNYTKRYPGAGFTAVRMDERGYIETGPEQSGLEECAAMGLGLCLIKREVLEAFGEKEAMFPFGFQDETGNYVGEDVMFMKACREKGFKVWCDHDTSKMVSHIGTFIYNWRDRWGSLPAFCSQVVMETQR